jgi:hypothetical protein
LIIFGGLVGSLLEGGALIAGDVDSVRNVGVGRGVAMVGTILQVVLLSPRFGFAFPAGTISVR